MLFDWVWYLLVCVCVSRSEAENYASKMTIKTHSK